VLRINLGCGPRGAPGWLNCDLRAMPGVDVQTDLCRGLPFAAASAECIAGIHLLQDLAWQELAPALRELHRVLKPGGVLRIAVPDLDKALRAYSTGDIGYFYVPDRDARSAGAKLVTQIVWYGSVRTPMTFEFLEEWMVAAGFAGIRRCRFGESRSPGLAELDNRERETLFVEAVREHAGRHLAAS
jgi:SAM-dependent methyltransferase